MICYYTIFLGKVIFTELLLYNLFSLKRIFLKKLADTLAVWREKMIFILWW